MTKQEAFNKVWERAKDKRISTFGASRFKCAYRSLDGLCCFIGALIPDDQYKPELEDKSAWRIMGRVPALQGLPDKFLLRLQRIHDQSPVELWEQRLRETAKAYGLTVEE